MEVHGGAHFRSRALLAEAQHRESLQGNALMLRYSFFGGWRNVKLLTSGECRKIRDCCIFRVNDLEVFL